MKGKAIDSADISVVIQGAVDSKNTPLLLRSVREYLPNAEIILSTWENSDLTYCNGCTDIVLNKDPGAAPMDVAGNSLLNLNRMLVSTKGGIQRATKKYILKCRSDVILIGNRFLQYFDAFNEREPQYCLAKHKIMLNSLYCMKCEAEGGLIHPTPFHISDWYCFGLQEDIRLLFSLSAVENVEFARYFAYHPKPREYAIPWLNHRLWKFPPEQYLGVMFAKEKFPGLTFPNCLAYDQVDMELSDRFIINNFIILDPENFSIVSNKNYYSTVSNKLYKAPEHVWNGLYREHIYLEDYKKYCDPSIKVPRDFLKIKRTFFTQKWKPADLKSLIFKRG